MRTFLEECEARLSNAKKAFQEAQQKHAMAQQEFAVAQAQLNLWTGAVNDETRRLEKEKKEQEDSKQGGVVTPELPKPTAPPSSSAILQSVAESAANSTLSPEPNKTEMIRDVLRNHPSGMTPAEIWEQLNGEVDRAYVYSVLKRLKDREQIAYKRKKYSLKEPPAPKAIASHAPATLQ